MVPWEGFPMKKAKEKGAQFVTTQRG